MQRMRIRLVEGVVEKVIPILGQEDSRTVYDREINKGKKICSLDRERLVLLKCDDE